MTAYNVEELLIRYERAEISEEELTFLLSIVQQWNENSNVEIEEVEFLRVRAEIAKALDQEVHMRKRAALWPRIAVAAALVLFVSIFYFSLREVASKRPHEITYANDIAPGKSGATLILADGKRIRLNEAAEGTIAREGGLVVRKMADGQVVYETSTLEQPMHQVGVNALATAKGETYMVTLPDQSKVWLNAASTLSYTTSLNAKRQRRVKLEGEAYFEISKDKSHPFIVETKGQEIEVLGTHFNVSAYADDAVTKTTLLEGRVKIAAWQGNGASSEVILQPGEESVLLQGKMDVGQADMELVMAWKNHKFMFESESIQHIMKVLERWYDVEVVYSGPAPENKFGGAVSKFDHVSKVLQILESTNKVHFKIEGRRIFVTK